MLSKVLCTMLVANFFLLASSSCELTKNTEPFESIRQEPEGSVFFRGADLSYVNEMEDCGALYFDEAGEGKNPFQIFQEADTDIIRLRLWHDPAWTKYSNFEDVKKSIARARALGMQVLLDFHYSDDWADPHKQEVPAAWLPVVHRTSVLGDSIYDYTFSVLNQLKAANLLPEFVQLGNEINSEILQAPNGNYDHIDWNRNAFLLNKALQAVRDAAAQSGKKIGSFLHIAQPEHALWWFEAAHKNGITDFDWIGLSYYPLWSEYSLEELVAVVETLTVTYNKRLMVVETAYPFTLEDNDGAGNILGEDAAIPGIAISPQGQFDYLKKLEKAIVEGGGEGLVYWEPAWVSTPCSTRWGQGSHWDNAALFDHQNKANIAIRYFGGDW